MRLHFVSLPYAKICPVIFVATCFIYDYGLRGRAEQQVEQMPGTSSEQMFRRKLLYYEGICAFNYNAMRFELSEVTSWGLQIPGVISLNSDGSMEGPCHARYTSMGAQSQLCHREPREINC